MKLSDLARIFARCMVLIFMELFLIRGTVPVITCHRESAALGLGSGHSDLLDWFPLYGKSMDDVRNDIAAAMGSISTTEPEKPAETTGYKVKILHGALNIRQGPGTNYPIVGVIRDRGVYTIVETNGTWGKLKSGKGWISLGYYQKL